MSVRSKRIKGHLYYYLVRNERRGKKVRQTVVKYLGKHGWAGVAPSRFTPIVNKQAEATYVRMFRRLGCTSVKFNIPFSNSGYFGNTRYYPLTHEFRVRFRRPANLRTMAHELGHVMDILMRRDAPDGTRVGSSAPQLLDFDHEFTRIADYTTTQRGTLMSKARLEKLHEWQALLPENATIPAHIEGITSKLSSYVYERRELFARLVSICFTEPRKAELLAPRATKWLMDALYEHPDIRKILTAFDCWELGTTSPDSPVDGPAAAR